MSYIYWCSQDMTKGQIVTESGMQPAQQYTIHIILSSFIKVCTTSRKYQLYTQAYKMILHTVNISLHQEVTYMPVASMRYILSIE